MHRARNIKMGRFLQLSVIKSVLWWQYRHFADLHKCSRRAPRSSLFPSALHPPLGEDPTLPCEVLIRLINAGFATEADRLLLDDSRRHIRSVHILTHLRRLSSSVLQMKGDCSLENELFHRVKKRLTSVTAK